MAWFSTCEPPAEVFPSSVSSDTLARDEWPWSSQRACQARSSAASRSAMIGTITLKVHGKDKPFPVKDGKVDHVPIGRKPTSRGMRRKNGCVTESLADFQKRVQGMIDAAQVRHPSPPGGLR